ncbi:MAG TPA: hypothetical protein VM639_00760 [Dongiaceae bacterium]|nr:hypothetical protein [Dongiaceae bacterium]
MTKPVLSRTATTSLLWEVSITERVWGMFFGISDEQRFEIPKKWMRDNGIVWSTRKSGSLRQLLFKTEKAALQLYEWLKRMDARTPAPMVVELAKDEENLNEHRKHKQRIEWSIKHERAKQRGTGERKSRSRKLQRDKSKSGLAKPVPEPVSSE